MQFETLVPPSTAAEAAVLARPGEGVVQRQGRARAPTASAGLVLPADSAEAPLTRSSPCRTVCSLNPFRCCLASTARLPAAKSSGSQGLFPPVAVAVIGWPRATEAAAGSSHARARRP